MSRRERLAAWLAAVLLLSMGIASMHYLAHPTPAPRMSALGGGTQVVQNFQSLQWVTWEIAVDGGAAPIVAARGSGAAYLAGNAVTSAGNLCVTTVSCTTSDAGAGPTTTGPDAGGADGTCSWVCYAGSLCPGGLTVVDVDQSNGALLGPDAYVQYLPVPPNNGSASQPLPKDPTKVYGKAAAGTPLLVVGCFQ